MITSVDIFDTALTRMVGNPDSVFILLGSRLSKSGLLSVSPEVFARSRKTAEVLSRRNAPNDESTLEEIYKALQWLLGLTPHVAEHAMQEELALERALLRALPDTQQLIREIQKAGEEMVFLSDMYLPSSFLKEQLVRLLGLPESPDVMVSCESRESKASGELFRRLLREKTARPKDVLHIGNDASADGVVPGKIGIRTKLLQQGNLNRYERILENHRWETAGTTSLLAGASRMARLSVPVKNVREQVIRDVAASVAAPVLVGYILWVLRRARELKLKRLYFVSRDGEVLLEIASRLIQRLDVKIELRYLYGSRQAWHLPAFGLSDRREEDWILENTDRVSVEIVLAKLALQPADIEGPLLKDGFPRNRWLTDLDQSDIEALQRILRQPEVRARILEQSAQARGSMLRYLQQEGMMDAIPIGVVDLGWTGRMFDSLAAVLKRERLTSPFGLLFGNYGRPITADGMPKEGYLLDRVLQQGYQDFGCAALLEMFCAGSHGMVVGYKEEDDGSMKPVFNKAVNQAAVHWGLQTLRGTIKSFLDHLCLCECEVPPGSDMRPAVADLLAGFWNDPTTLEAEVWGSYQHYDIQTESYGCPLAMPFRIRHVFTRLQGKPVRNIGAAWGAGSYRLTPPMVRHGIRAAGWVRRMGRELIYTLQGRPQNAAL